MVVLLLVTALIVTPFLRVRGLAARLESEVAARDKAVWPRVPPVQLATHDNGYACLAGMLRVAPPDMTPFVGSKADVDPVRPWLGDAPLDTLPEAIVERRKLLRAWMESTRACGDSRELKPVAGLTPWAPPPNWARLLMGLARFTVLDVREALAEGKNAEAAGLCHAAAALLADQSHLGLAGAIIGGSGLKLLAQPCAQALNLAPRPVPPALKDSWAALLARYASAAEVLDTERLNSGITLFGGLTNARSLPTVEAPLELDNWYSRYEAALAWPEWDARTRALVDGARQSPEALEAALKRLEAAGSSGFLAAIPNFGPMLAHIDSTRVALQVLAWLAAGAEGEPPVGVTRVDGAVEWPDGDRDAWRVPVPG